MIKAVIFDFGQTMVDSADGFRQAEKEAQEKLFGHLALSLREKFLDHYRQLRKEFHGRSNFSRRVLWQEVYHYYCLVPDAGLLGRWEAEYWDTVKAHSILFPEAMGVLKALTTRFGVALITNTQGQPASGSHRLSQFPQLETYFKPIIVAGENGIPAKPDPAPFRMCVDALGVAPAEAVYVGDDWRIDVCGSRDAGLNPVWIKHETVKRNWPAVKPDVPVITRLDQLFGLDLLQT
ncbi:MAG TPA: HAD family hydrolase [Desulfobacterales bacterium]|jgi:putative hydrolase of the HAD superfamily|nr:HAD family hydrolase [Desulfobacterales bacterium]